MPAIDALETKTHPRRKLWTREEASKLAELFPGERYELIEGELIDKMGQKPPHAYVVAALTEFLTTAFPGRVRIQCSIALPEPEGCLSEPEPDVVLLRRKSREFFERHPGPADIALLIEVAESTLGFDRSVKAALYARSGIAECWIIDVVRSRTIMHRHPAGEEYRSITLFEAADEISPLAEPGLVFSLERLLS